MEIHSAIYHERHKMEEVLRLCAVNVTVWPSAICIQAAALPDSAISGTTTSFRAG